MASWTDKALDLGGKAWESLTKDYFKNWLQCLERPGTPVFKPGSFFSGLEGRLARLFATCTTLTGAVLGLDWLLPGSHGGHVSLGLLTWIASFGAAAVSYQMYSRVLFRIRLSITQTFFIFAFVVLPWIPIFAVVNAFGRRVSFGPLFLLVEMSLCAIVVFYLAIGVKTIAGVGMNFALFSLLFGPIILVLAYVLAPHLAPPPTKAVN
ncbi:MAG: hypothetical protein ABSC48_07545 [Terracidiphilus sp.]|jgi:hypothetical protein